MFCYKFDGQTPTKIRKEGKKNKDKSKGNEKKPKDKQTTKMEPKDKSK